jgi:tetratricopeptide (TPR) repeat protein
MKFRTAYVVLVLLCSFSPISLAQDDSSRALVFIDHYALRVTIDEEEHQLRGDAQVRLHLMKDSVSRIRFDFGPSAVLIAVRDTSDKTGKEFSIALPDSLKRGDTLLLKLSYERSYDTLSTLASFIGEREIVLLPGDGDRWWPVLSPVTNPLRIQTAPVILETTLSSGFTVVSNRAADSSRSAGTKTTWIFAQSKPMPLTSCFQLCASKDFSKRVADGADSSTHISLYYDPARFSANLAGAVLHQLHDACAFYAVAANFHEQCSDLRVAMIGTDDGHATWYKRDGIIIGRNSSSYSAYDTSALLSSEMSKWVYELAGISGIAATDSSFWLSSGWSTYLAAEFFLQSAQSDPEMQRHIRLGLLSRTLEFYPAQSLGQGLNSQKNEQALFFNKGAYIFLMLEYVMGEGAFKAVVDSIVKNNRAAPLNVLSFQRLCEETYGSSLEWFFTEWVNRTGFPELVLSTEIIQTNRGNYSVKATIGQRGDVFTTPVDIVFSNKVRTITKRVFVTKQDQEFEFILPFLPTRGELDPNYYLLRWVPRLRLLAHARTSVSFRVFDRDLPNSEHEAAILLQLDPNNLTGWNNLALFSLGKSSVLKGELTKAEEYFRRASALEASDPTQLYSVLSLVRLGNVLEMEGKRDEAIELYKLSVTLAERRPAFYGIALFEAQKYLRQKFVSSDDFWYGEY